MFVYQVMQGPAKVPAGTILQLSDTQANSRKRQLRAFPGGWFIALSALTFQTGDVVTFCIAPDPEAAIAFTPPELTVPVLCRFNDRFVKIKPERPNDRR